MSQTVLLLVAPAQAMSAAHSVCEKAFQVANVASSFIETALPLSSASSMLSTVGYTAQPSASFTATPTSGPAPLTVTFAGTINGSYAVNYGDRSLGPAIMCDGTCNNIHIKLIHTYTFPGTYIATLTSDGTAVGSATIKVTKVN